MRRYRRRTRSQYLLPFIVLVSLGVFLILAFQLWGSFFPTVKGDALFFLADGRSKVLSFGTTEWGNIYNGTKVKLGDSVKTLHSAKGVLQFYDGTIVRLDQDTQVTLVDISDKNDYDQILLYLNSGKVWVNKPKQTAIRKTNFLITTNYASYTDTGTVFDLEKLTDEILHVIKGQVQVDILETVDGKTRTIESVPVGIGQQIVLNEPVMQAYYQRQSPSVLGALDPIFQTDDWYLWNSREDENPTDFSKHGGGALTDSQASPDSSSAVSASTLIVDAPKSDLAVPTLVSPKSAMIQAAKDNQDLSGKVADGTKKLLLKQLVAGDMEAQKILINTLDTTKLTWSYSVSAQKGNLKPGKNIYDFVGIDDNARETEALHVEIDYQAPAEPDLANNPTDLQKPVVATVDGKAYQSGMSIDHDGFSFSGSASGADQIWVDDFQLSKFKKGDATWSYNVKVSYGNLKPGLNSYKVYGVTVDGRKSPILTVQINYKAPVVKSAVAASSVSSAAVVPAVVAPTAVVVPAPVTVVSPESPVVR